MKKYVVIVANVLFPGLGTVLANRMSQGVLQILFAMLGLLLWSTISLRPLAILIYLFAWLWALFSSLKYKREADQIELHPVSIIEERSRNNT